MRKYALILMLSVGVSSFGAGIYSAHAQAQSSKNQTKNVMRQEPTSQSDEKKPVNKKYVSVKTGDSLIKISAKSKVKYPRLFDANTQIKDPDVIHPGDKIRIPHPSEKLRKRQIVSTAVASPTYSYVPTSASTAPRSQVSGGVWDQIAACESGGNWNIDTGNGYYGGLQFSQSSWNGVGGQGSPANASKAEQIKRGEMLQARQGWGAWPSCSAKLGLR